MRVRTLIAAAAAVVLALVPASVAPSAAPRRAEIAGAATRGAATPSAARGAATTGVTTAGAPSAGVSIAAAGPGGRVTCTIADAELWATRPIDSSSCDLEGDGDAAHQAQNEAKNNLCAGGFLTSSPQQPSLATQLTFRKLQTAAEAIREAHNLGAQTVPADRTPFAGAVHTTTEGDAIGEGSLVRYVGFLIEGHFSGKEGVNCSRANQENYDIHLAFSSTKPALSLTKAQGESLECKSVTAEIIPRRRPDEWSLLGSMKKTGAKGLRAAIEKIEAQELRRPLRITGQLFFDGSHAACQDGEAVGGNPARASNWEIHPVYAVDVCEFATASKCKWNNEAVWTPLHQWVERN